METNPVFQCCAKCLLKICCTDLCDEFEQEREKYFSELTELLDTYVYTKSKLRNRVLNACVDSKQRDNFGKKMSERRGNICSAPPNHIKIRIRVLTDKISYSNFRIRKTYKNDNECAEVMRKGIC